MKHLNRVVWLVASLQFSSLALAELDIQSPSPEELKIESVAQQIQRLDYVIHLTCAKVSEGYFQAQQKFREGFPPTFYYNSLRVTGLSVIVTALSDGAAGGSGGTFLGLKRRTYISSWTGSMVSSSTASVAYATAPARERSAKNTLESEAELNAIVWSQSVANIVSLDQASTETIRRRLLTAFVQTAETSALDQPAVINFEEILQSELSHNELNALKQSFTAQTQSVPDPELQRKYDQSNPADRLAQTKIILEHSLKIIEQSQSGCLKAPAIQEQLRRSTELLSI